MTDIEQEARDLLNGLRKERGRSSDYWVPGDSRHHFYTIEAVCRALEQRDAERQAHAEYRQRVSDAMLILQEYIVGSVGWQRGDRVHFVELPGDRRVTFSDFIIPKPVDPLVEAIREMALTDATPEDAERLRAALAKRGLVVREEG